jgi:hypothetical protein
MALRRDRHEPSAAAVESFRVAAFESAPERLTIDVPMAVVAAIAIVRVTIAAVTRVREIAPVPHVVISAVAADSETVPVGPTFELLRVAGV